MGAIAGPERRKHGTRKARSKLSDIRVCLLTATLLLGGLSVLYSLSSTQLRLTSEADYRRLSFIATIRPQQESADRKPPVCESIPLRMTVLVH